MSGVTAGAGIVEAGLLLRPAEVGDAQRWLEMLGDSDYQRYGAPADLPQPSGGRALATRVTSSVTAWTDRSPGTLVIALGEDPGLFLGTIGWRWSITDWFGAADLGYCVHPDARGRGMARRAMVAMTRWLMSPEGHGLARVQLDHSTENPASCRAALAAGFEREGVRRGYLPLRDTDGTVRRHDVCQHGRITPPA